MNGRSVLLLALCAASSGAAEADVAATRAPPVVVAFEEPAYDPLQALIDDEARAAMNAGRYRRASRLFGRLLQIDPSDTRALREAGRVAQALGDFHYAVEALGRVEAMRGGHPDAELHFLRGEALRALGRRAESDLEWAAAARDLALAPLDRRGTMWLARMEAVRGELAAALARYASVRSDERRSSAHAEISLYEVEAYILAHDWAGALQRLRAFLRDQPGHARGEELLAWVLEVEGHLDEALPLRARFADEWSEHPRKLVDYARALEGAHEDRAALARYREARALGVDDIDRDIDRLRDRLTPELAGGGNRRGDITGDITGWSVGATVPIDGRHRIAASASHDTASGGAIAGTSTASSIAAWLLITGRRGARVGVGVNARDGEHDGGVGASALARSSPASTIQLQVRGDYNLAWRESARTIREGGVVDGFAIAVFVDTGWRRVLASGSMQLRRLGLATAPDRGAQTFASVGLDYAVTGDPHDVARGELLDDEMLSPRTLTTSAVLSLRHYEMVSETPFDARLALVERSTIDEVSGALRLVIDRRGMVGAEVRAGAGRDWIRELVAYRLGASLLLSLTRSSRFAFDYDLASEGGLGFVGRRHAGSAVLHVDL